MMVSGYQFSRLKSVHPTMYTAFQLYLRRRYENATPNLSCAINKRGFFRGCMLSSTHRTGQRTHDNAQNTQQKLGVALSYLERKYN